MRLVSFGAPGSEQPGVLRDDGRVSPLGPLLPGAPALPGPSGMNEILAHLPALRDPIEALAAGPDPAAVPVEAVRLGPPVPAPGAIVAVGANYRAHIEEITGSADNLPSLPVLFIKPATSLGGPNDPVVRPAESAELDYECELAVVIGRGGRRIEASDALGHVAGYMIANDVSARDVMLRDIARGPAFFQVARGKGYDTFCPTGPWLLTADEVPDPQALTLRTWVNGAPRQHGTSADMVFGVAEIIASVSEFMTLRPGDVILTGTPAGVGISQNPPAYLEPGDVLRLTVTGLGTMETKIASDA
ncbi:fumarylacetoacetate hydrolase family protein [Streptomyces sp. NPDC093252]|uniref:fumarylacetoacetate hydrolase family protein n=1 Tax=Streptomyces sp. NPDC093252 TaxID=3154980 RepID=UPI003446FBBC